jgi:hypothetical protein
MAMGRYHPPPHDHTLSMDMMRHRQVFHWEIGLATSTRSRHDERRDARPKKLYRPHWRLIAGFRHRFLSEDGTRRLSARREADQYRWAQMRGQGQ